MQVYDGKMYRLKHSSGLYVCNVFSRLNEFNDQDCMTRMKNVNNPMYTMDYSAFWCMDRKGEVCYEISTDDFLPEGDNSSFEKIANQKPEKKIKKSENDEFQFLDI